MSGWSSHTLSSLYMPLPEEKLNHGSFAASQAATHSSPRGAAATAASASSTVPRDSGPATSSSTARRASFLSSSSGLNRSTSMPCTIFAMPEVGDPGERLLAEPEEVQVGDVAEVQELEVVLERAVGELDRAVVVLGEREMRVVPGAADDVLHRDPVGQRLEGQRLELADHLEILRSQFSSSAGQLAK